MSYSSDDPLGASYALCKHIMPPTLQLLKANSEACKPHFTNYVHPANFSNESRAKFLMRICSPPCKIVNSLFTSSYIHISFQITLVNVPCDLFSDNFSVCRKRSESDGNHMSAWRIAPSGPAAIFSLWILNI